MFKWIKRNYEKTTGSGKVWQNNAAYIGGGKVLFRARDGHAMIVYGADLSIGCHLVLGGLWEPDVVRVIAGQLSAGARVVEVGANVGAHSLAIARCIGDKGRLLAIEANPDLAQLLQANLDINGYFNRSRVVSAAAKDTKGDVQFFTFRDHLGASTLLDVREWAKGFADQAEPLVVRGVTVDDETADWPAADMLKIDAEGAEIHILRGAEKLIERSKAIKIVIEISAPSRGLGVYDFLQSRGFVICPILGAEPPVPMADKALDKINFTADALCYRAAS